MSKSDHVNEQHEKRFPNVIVFKCQVLRPRDEYPYEHAVWESEIRAPIDATTKHVESLATTWLKTMEAGLELAQLNAKEEQSD